MLIHPFRFELGPYWILIPESANISAEIRRPGPGEYRTSFTHWVISLGRFQLFAHLDPVGDLGRLKSFIDGVTKSDVITTSIAVNGVQGVTHGGYGPSRTWIDWYFKKGDVMLCLNLQSLVFPVSIPSEVEKGEHKEIISSIKYCRDFADELPPISA